MTEPQAADEPESAEAPLLLLTWTEWRAVLERRSFLEREDNSFQTPRRLCGRAVQIVPDDSFR